MAGLPSSAVPQPLANLVTENCLLDLMFLAEVLRGGSRRPSSLWVACVCPEQPGLGTKVTVFTKVTVYLKCSSHVNQKNLPDLLSLDMINPLLGTDCKPWSWDLNSVWFQSLYHYTRPRSKVSNI